MRPCRKYKKQIAAVTSSCGREQGTLDLMAHIETCPACCDYWREMSGLCNACSNAIINVDQIPIGDWFHTRLVQRIRSAGSHNAFSPGESLRKSALGWRGAMALLLLACVIPVLILRPLRHRKDFGTLASAPVQNPVVNVESIKRRTLGEYSQALNISPDALEDILTRQAKPGTSPPAMIASYPGQE